MLKHTVAHMPRVSSVCHKLPLCSDSENKQLPSLWVSTVNRTDHMQMCKPGLILLRKCAAFTSKQLQVTQRNNHKALSKAAQSL